MQSTNISNKENIAQRNIESVSMQGKQKSSDVKDVVDLYEMVSVLGKGAYGKVLLVRKKYGKQQGKMFAMKTLKKKDVIQINQTDNTMTEWNILSKMNHPFII